MFPPRQCSLETAVSSEPALARAAQTKVLDYRPVLWVGAGASMAAGYPSTGRLVAAMIESADDRPLPDLFAEQRRRVIEQLDRLSGLRSVRSGLQLRFGFAGRRKPRVEAIRRWCQGQRVRVVQGLGGLGKIALCAEVAPIFARMLADFHVAASLRDANPVSERPDHVAASLRDAVAGFGETGLGDANILALDGRIAGLRAEPILSLWEEIAAADSGDDWQQILAQHQQDGITGQAAAAAILQLACRRGSLLVYLDDAERCWCTCTVASCPRRSRSSCGPKENTGFPNAGNCTAATGCPRAA